jgi:hypothetical protein
MIEFCQDIIVCLLAVNVKTIDGKTVVMWPNVETNDRNLSRHYRLLIISGTVVVTE